MLFRKNRLGIETNTIARIDKMLKCEFERLLGDALYWDRRRLAGNLAHNAIASLLLALRARVQASRPAVQPHFETWL